MKTIPDRPNTAVVYMRVSTDDQANTATSIPGQQKICQQHAEGRELKIIREFIDAGESGRTDDRPEFQKMLAFCTTHPHDIGYVLVQNLSRFARNIKDQTFSLELLRRDGIQLISAEESQIDETPAGELQRNIFGAINQFSSQSHAEKMKVRSRMSVEAGRWPHQTPTGYINIRSKRGPNIAPDPKIAPFIRECFGLFATGLYSQRDVLRIMTEKGLVTKNGKPYIPQEFQKMLCNPMYAGWICRRSDPDLKVKGEFEPIVDQALWDRVDGVIHDRKPINTPKRRVNPSFPLRGTLRCEPCAALLTAANSRSETGRLYGYYYCRTAGCRAVKSLSLEAADREFMALILRLQPTTEMVEEFPQIARGVWNAHHASAEANAKKITAELEKTKCRKSKLLRAKLDGEVAQEDYQQANAEFTNEITDLERQLRGISAPRADLETFVRFAEIMVADIPAVWQRANDDQRRRVRQILFPDGISVTPEKKLSNSRNSSLFSLLDGMIAEKTRELGNGAP